MLRRILCVALIAGALSGFVMSGVQMLWSVPLIHAAEEFETPASEPTGHVHTHADGMQHDHATGAVWAPKDGFERTLWTVITNIILGVGAGLIMTAFMALRKNPTTVLTGVLYGIGAFASISLAPALGLPPELPGMAAADLQGRQAWWLLTAVSTASSIALLVYAPSVLIKIAAVALLVIPHIVGAPQPLSHETAVPAGLISEFIVASLVTTGIFWIALGGAVGLLAAKFKLDETELAPVPA